MQDRTSDLNTKLWNLHEISSVTCKRKGGEKTEQVVQTSRYEICMRYVKELQEQHNKNTEQLVDSTKLWNLFQTDKEPFR